MIVAEPRVALMRYALLWLLVCSPVYRFEAILADRIISVPSRTTHLVKGQCIMVWQIHMIVFKREFNRLLINLQM